MGKAISADLRTRMIRSMTQGQSRRALAERYDVAPSTAVRLQARFDATGSIAPDRQGRPTNSGKLDPYRIVLIEKVEAQPDITMPELASWLESVHGVTADPSNLSKLLCRAGFTFKKNAAGGGKRTR